MDKSSLRKVYQKRRMTLSPAQKSYKDRAIEAQVLAALEGKHSIGIYCSLPDEVDTHALITRLFQLGYAVRIPRVEGKTMHFYDVNSWDDLEPGVWGILEPTAMCKRVEASDIDVLVLPLLAYNQRNYRLGYGGGYYDRYLVDYTGLKLGVAYVEQETSEAFETDTDIACDCMLVA